MTLVTTSPDFFLFYSTSPQPPTSTLFPYTTLFRSKSSAIPRPITSNFDATRAGGPRRGSSEKAAPLRAQRTRGRSEEHTSELQSLTNLVCRLLLEKKKI